MARRYKALTKMTSIGKSAKAHSRRQIVSGMSVGGLALRLSLLTLFTIVTTWEIFRDFDNRGKKQIKEMISQCWQEPHSDLNDHKKRCSDLELIYITRYGG